MKIEKGIKTGPLKLCIYGTEGIGKTTLAANAPAPLFIDLESGSKQLDVARTEPVPTDWNALLEQVNYVANNPEVCDTLVIDTADKAENLCIEYICERENKTSLGSFGFGTGYQFLAEEFEKLLKSLNACIENGINVIVIAHSQLKKFEQPDEVGAYDRYELKLQKKTSPLLKEWCDGLFFCNYKTIVETIDSTNKAYGGERVIYTTHHPAWDAKNRFGLDDEIPLSYKSIDGLLPSKSVVTDTDLKIDDDFSLLDDEDFAEITTVHDEIRKKLVGTGLSEKQVVEGFMKCNQMPKGLTIGEEPKIENFDEEWLEDNVLARFDKFVEFVRKSI